MPVDPSISLNVPQAPAAANPLSTIGGYLDIQNKMNQNQQFQQVFHAKQRAGEIISSAPSPEEGMQNLLKDPTVAPFAGQIINEYKQGQLFTEQLSGEKLKNNNTALQAVVKASMAGYHDPSQFAPALASAMQNLPPALQERVAPALKTWTSSLMTGLPSDPAQAKTVYQQRLFAKFLAAGVDPGVIAAMTGTPKDVNVGGQDVFGTQMPAALGGGFQPAAGGPAVGSLGRTLPPTITDVPQRDGSTQKQIVGGGGAPSLAGPMVGSPGGGGATMPPSLAAPMAQPQVLGQTPNATDAAVLPKRGQNIAQREEILNQDVEQGAQLNKVIGWAQEAMKHFTPGGGANQKAAIAATMQGLGFPQETVDKVSNGSLAGYQQFVKDVAGAVSQVAESSIPQGSRLSVAALVNAGKANAQPNLDPRAVDQLFSNYNTLYKQRVDEQKTYNDYRLGQGDYKGQGPGDLSLWPQKWQEISTQKGYVNPSTALRVGNPQDYETKDQVKADFDAGKLTREAARELLKHPKFGLQQ